MAITYQYEYLDRRIADSSHFPGFLDRRGQTEALEFTDEQRREAAGAGISALIQAELIEMTESDDIAFNAALSEELPLYGEAVSANPVTPEISEDNPGFSWEMLLGYDDEPAEDSLTPATALTTIEAPTAYSSEYSNGPLKVRGARNTPDDLNKLVALELAAFSDVYGQTVSRDQYESVRAKYAHRLDKMANWMKVIEDQDTSEIMGMVIGCPTNFDHEELAKYDMTTPQALDEVYDEEGKNLYIVNLATHPDAPKNLRFNLLGGIMAEGFRSHVERAYFESRLPGFNAWVDAQYIQIEENDHELRDELADMYWRQVEYVNDKPQPIDKLLRLYTQLGAKPIRLVPEAWEEDKPSNSYGVLCEFENPLPGRLANSRVVRKMAAKLIDLGVNNKTIMQAVFKR